MSTLNATVRPLRRDAEENRNRILAAAAEVFASRGLTASLDDVARRAGVGVGTVYRRFPDKATLVEALFEQRIRGLVELADQAALELDPWAGIVLFLTGACEQMSADRGLRDAVLCSEHGSAGLALARSELAPRLDALTAHAQRSGRLRADVAATDLVVLLKSVHVLDDGGGHWRRHLTILLDGLCAARRGSTPLPGTALTDEELQQALTGLDGR